MGRFRSLILFGVVGGLGAGVRTEVTLLTMTQRAAFPNAAVRHHKFWPFVGRVNNVLGDRKLVCSCPPIKDDV